MQNNNKKEGNGIFNGVFLPKKLPLIGKRAGYCSPQLLSNQCPITTRMNWYDEETLRE
jgi:hypothetical protein